MCRWPIFISELKESFMKKIVMVTIGILICLVQSMTASVQTQAKVTSSLVVPKLSREIAELAVCRSPFLVYSVCMAGERIVSGCGDGALRINDIKGNELAAWKGHAGLVYSVCIEGGRIIITISILY